MTTTDSPNDYFAPATFLRNILDGDLITADVRTGEDSVRNVHLVARGRCSVIADPGQDVLIVDQALGQLQLASPAPVTPGHAYLVDISNPTPVIVEDLGPATSDYAITRRVLSRHQLPYPYPVDAVAQAAAARLDAQDLPADPSRRDFTGACVITIDDDHSTDLDDAIGASADPDGSVRIWVHIADVAEHIKPGSPIDQAAAACPTSVYLPQHVRHMLPEALASDRLSLLPGVVRDTMTVEMRISAEGHVSSVDVYQSRIRSRQRLSYTTVAKALSGHTQDLDPDILRVLRLARAAAIRLGQQCVTSGGIDANREPGHDPSEEPAHQLIERLMVATNEAVARWSTDRGLPTLYRTHEPFSDTAANELETVAEGFGLYAGLPRPVTPQAFAALAAQAEQAGVGPAFWEATQPLTSRATYTATPGGHFGLGSAAYLHFTSPLRRYADLITHRMVKAYIHGHRDTPAYSTQDINAHATVINTVTRAASLAERDARTTAGLLEVKARQVRKATVIGVTSRGIRVLLDTDAGTVGVLAKGNSGRVGQHLNVRVRNVDALRGTLELTAVDGQSPTQA